MEARNYLLQINTFLANHFQQTVTDIPRLREPTFVVIIPRLWEC